MRELNLRLMEEQTSSGGNSDRVTSIIHQIDALKVRVTYLLLKGLSHVKDQGSEGSFSFYVDPMLGFRKKKSLQRRLIELV